MPVSEAAAAAWTAPHAWPVPHLPLPWRRLAPAATKTPPEKQLSSDSHHSYPVTERSSMGMQMPSSASRPRPTATRPRSCGETAPAAPPPGAGSPSAHVASSWHAMMAVQARSAAASSRTPPPREKRWSTLRAVRRAAGGGARWPLMPPPHASLAGWGEGGGRAGDRRAHGLEGFGPSGAAAIGNARPRHAHALRAACPRRRPGARRGAVPLWPHPPELPDETLDVFLLQRLLCAENLKQLPCRAAERVGCGSGCNRGARGPRSSSGGARAWCGAERER
jgi:hypothetical protein